MHVVDGCLVDVQWSVVGWAVSRWSVGWVVLKKPFRSVPKDPKDLKQQNNVHKGKGGGKEKWLGLDAVHGRIFEHYVGEFF